MIRSMLLECQAMLSNADDVRDQSNCLLHGVQAKVYQPLFQRPMCRKFCAAVATVCTFLFIVSVNQVAGSSSCYILSRSTFKFKLTVCLVWYDVVYYVNFYPSFLMVMSNVSLQVAWKTVLNTL